MLGHIMGTCTLMLVHGLFTSAAVVYMQSSVISLIFLKIHAAKILTHFKYAIYHKNSLVSEYLCDDMSINQYSEKNE